MSEKINKTSPKSLAKTTASVSAPSPGVSDADFAGFVLCSKTKCTAIKAKLSTPSKKWITVNLFIAQEVTVPPAKIPETISSPRAGTTESKFKITRHAQNDMFPETTTYPVKAVPRDRRKIAAPTTQIKIFTVETTLENASAFEKCTIVEITTKLAPSMCSIRNSQTAFPWKHIEINSKKFVSRDQARIPSKKNPEISWITQKIKAIRAMEWPRWMRCTGKSETSCLAKSTRKRGRVVSKVTKSTPKCKYFSWNYKSTPGSAKDFSTSTKLPEKVTSDAIKLASWPTLFWCGLTFLEKKSEQGL